MGRNVPLCPHPRRRGKDSRGLGTLRCTCHVPATLYQGPGPSALLQTPQPPEHSQRCLRQQVRPGQRRRERGHLGAGSTPSPWKVTSSPGASALV